MAGITEFVEVVHDRYGLPDVSIRSWFFYGRDAEYRKATGWARRIFWWGRITGLRVGDGDDGYEGGGDPFFAEVDGDAAGEGHPGVDIEKVWARHHFEAELYVLNAKC